MAQPIVFGGEQESGLDELSGASPVSLNVVRDSKGTVRRRPGILPYEGAPEEPISEEAIIGLYRTLDGNLMAIADENGERPIYRVRPNGYISASSAAGTGLNGSKRPTFAETELLLVISGGASIQKLILSSNVSSRLGGDPPQSSHVVANSGRILSNDTTVDRTKMRYSDIALGNTTYAGHEVWTQGIGTAGFVTAETRPDPILAVADSLQEVFAFGTNTTQVFTPDPSFVYSSSVTIPVGIGAPYSIVQADESLFWLDHNRRFVMSTGRGYTDISAPLKATLDAITDVSDCFGYRVFTGSVDALVWTFPSDGRTFVFQQGAGWGQWASSGRGVFGVTAHHLGRGDGANIVGTSDGRIGRMASSAQTDFDDPIEAYVDTGFINRGTELPKFCKMVRLVLRRGSSSGSTEPVGFLRWRDDLGPWCEPIPVSIGASGDNTIVVELRSLGTYRRRQWRFVYSGTTDLVLVAASEDFEVVET